MGPVRTRRGSNEGLRRPRTAAETGVRAPRSVDRRGAFELFGGTWLRRQRPIRAVLRQAGLRDRYFGEESFADLERAAGSRLRNDSSDEEAHRLPARQSMPVTGPSAKAAGPMIDTLTRSLEGNPGPARRIKLRESGFRRPPNPESNRKKAAFGHCPQLVADPAAGGGTPSTTVNGLFLGLGVVGPPPTHTRSPWLDGGNWTFVAAKDVVDHVMLLFDAIAARITLSPSRLTGNQ